MKPFDLEAAKRGEPIQTRGGKPAKFIAHVPEATQPQQVVVLIGNSVRARYPNGTFHKWAEDDDDLFMASRKRTVWVNLYPMSEGKACYWYNTEKAASEAGGTLRIGNRAWPLEIEE
jgi:hypothetical protein